MVSYTGFFCVDGAHIVPADAFTVYTMIYFGCLFSLEQLLNAVLSMSVQVVGFDIVDDESRPERRPTKHMPKPSEWTNEFNPAFSYYAYYCYANLYTLNKVCLISS